MSALIKSKRFLTAIAGLVATIVVHFVPELEQHAETITGYIVIVFTAAIAGYSAQDVASAARGNK